MGCCLLFHGQGDHDRAFADYDQVLRIDSDYAPVYSIRGASHFDRGDYEAAIADYDQAFRLDPVGAEIFGGRGLSSFYVGRFAEAVADWQLCVLVRPCDAFAAIWLYLARARAGQDGKAALARNTARRDLGEWPGPVIKMFLGQMTGAAVLALDDGAPTSTSNKRREEAFFYVGQQWLLAGDREGARDLFRRAMETGYAGSVENRGAEAELRRMGEA
ncbi:MAG: tetratricopeptide repeat protein [Alphaproteobacteria bacterium]